MKTFLGSNIKYLRENNNLEQRDLAEALGYKSPSVVSDWENGKKKPNIGAIHDMSRLFNVTIDQLVNTDLSADGKDPYYLNPESARIAQEAYDNPDLRMLFDAAKDVEPEALKTVIDMVKLMKKEEHPELEDYPDEFPEEEEQVFPED